MTASTAWIRIGEENDDGSTTERFQDALDACHETGGGTVAVSSGEYVIGTIQLRSDVTLRLEAGAVVKPVMDRSEYVDRHVGPDGERPFVLAEGVENVSIVGEGTIDGRGTEFMQMDEPIRQHSGESEGHPLVSNAPHRARQGEGFLDRSGTVAEWPVAKPPFRPGPILLFADAEGVSIRNVTLRDMPAWTVSLEDCENVDVRGVTIRNHMQIPNCDGIEIGNSRNVRLSDCTIESCDDAITIVADEAADRDCEHLTVTNCSLSSSACAIKFGSETGGDIRHCTFENCVVYGSNRGLGIQHRDGGTIEHVLFSNITIETQLRPGPWWGKGEPIYVTSVPRDEETELGTVRNVRFSNVVAEAESGIFVCGHEESTLEGVSFHSISLSIRGSPYADEVGGNADLQPTSVTAPIYEEAISGIHGENVTDFELHDVSLEWDEELPAYFAHGIRCLEADDVVIDGFTGRQARTAETDADGSVSCAAIALERTARSTIRNSRAAPGTRTFLAASDCREERLLANNDLTDARTPIEGTVEYRSTGNVPPLSD